MKNLRKYGNMPYRVAVIHGGPGAPGEMAPVARELAAITGVLEPLQTEDSIDGQVTELYAVLKQNAELPVVLIGHSWGAWLSYIFTSRHPSLVRKLILIGTPPFPVENARDVTTTRLERLGEEEKDDFFTLVDLLNHPEAPDKNRVMARFGELANRADTYEALPHDDELIEYQFDINLSVWAEASILRGRGELLAVGKEITCPVVAIHGDYDPHPAAGVREPLSRVLKDFIFILLEKCGHEPWIEKYARSKFYEILKKEMA
jgi:pimeloyl-ACP methyl ester carboxylesterase